MLWLKYEDRLRIFVGVTDNGWFDFLSARQGVDEINFWQPGGNRQFRALQPGELFLFKLKGQRNAIAGGGYFAWSTMMPLAFAWAMFQEKNGAASLDALRRSLIRLRHNAGMDERDFQIGCVLLAHPFFFPEEQWIHVPDTFALNLTQGRGYDLTEPDGKRLWDAVHDRLTGQAMDQFLVDSARDERPDPRRVWVEMRLGQATFRSMVASAYDWRCAVTGERVLPVLEAAHIQPYAAQGPNAVQNGLLLRADIHRLMDEGYATVTNDLRFDVSRHVRAEFENGKDYYALLGKELRMPPSRILWPASEYIAWHNQHTFRR